MVVSSVGIIRDSSSAISAGSSFSASKERPRRARKLSSSPPTVSESSMPCAARASIWAVKSAAVLLCCKAAVSPNWRAVRERTPVTLSRSSAAASIASTMHSQYSARLPPMLRLPAELSVLDRRLLKRSTEISSLPVFVTCHSFFGAPPARYEAAAPARPRPAPGTGPARPPGADAPPFQSGSQD